MINIKNHADKLMEECEKNGFSAVVAISDPNNIEWGGIVRITGPGYCTLADLAGVFIAIEENNGIQIDRMLYDIRKTIKRYKKLERINKR